MRPAANGDRTWQILVAQGGFDPQPASGGHARYHCKYRAPARRSGGD